MRETLSIWVIYDHPSDHPDHFVARRWSYDRPTADIKLARDVVELRSEMMAMGLACIARAHSDDAKIMETWL